MCGYAAVKAGVGARRRAVIEILEEGIEAERTERTDDPMKPVAPVLLENH